MGRPGVQTVQLLSELTELIGDGAHSHTQGSGSSLSHHTTHHNLYHGQTHQEKKTEGLKNRVTLIPAKPVFHELIGLSIILCEVFK